MANDVSYFKLEGDSTDYAFNDKDAEARITQLATDLAAEIARAQDAEQANADAVVSEAARASAAEQTNADAISTETTRAQGVEGSLSSLNTTAKTNLVAAVNELNGKVNLVTYSSVTQLGMTSGAATIADVLNAMPYNSMLVSPAEAFLASEVPNIYGVIRITKSNNISRTVIEFLGKEDANGDYRMYLNSSNAPTGTWLRNGRPYAQTVDATIAAGSTSTTVTAPAVTGRTFLCWLAVATIGWQGAAYCASPVSALSNVFTSSGTSASDRTVRCTALYI